MSIKCVSHTHEWSGYQDRYTRVERCRRHHFTKVVKGGMTVRLDACRECGTAVPA